MQHTRSTMIVAGKIAADPHQGGATSAVLHHRVQRFWLRAPSTPCGWPATCAVLLALMAVMVSGAYDAEPNQSVLAAGIQQPVADTPWPDQAYRVEWAEVHLPAEVAPGVRIAVPVTMRNSGNRVWPASQVFVSYHWFRDDRLLVWDGERTPCHATCAPAVERHCRFAWQHHPNQDRTC